MSLRTSNSVERNTTAVPTIPKVIPAATSTVVLNDVSADPIEYAGRYIQNVGANPLYYSIGGDCSNNNFNGILSAGNPVDSNGYASGQQFDASNVAGKISVYSVLGTVVSTTLVRRNDIAPGNGGIL